MSRKVFFVVPELRRPTGGMNVTIDLMNDLRGLGRDVEVLAPVPGYRYDFYDGFPEATYDPRLSGMAVTRFKRQSKARRIEKWVQKRFGTRRGAAAALPDIPAGSIVVVPEYRFARLAPIYARAGASVVVLAQDVFGLGRAMMRARDEWRDHVSAVLTTSEAVGAMVDLLGTPHHGRLALRLRTDRFRYGADKARRIVYLPRKRAKEARIVTELLAARPALRDFEIVPVDRVSFAEMADILHGSLVFLSFSHQEGFGLPPAEAMASGCLVVGYTGVGGEEYFTEETGFPVPDGDIVAFVRQVEAVLDAHAADPAELDAKRRAASEAILSRYGPDAAAARTASVWADLEAHLNAGG